MATISWYAWMTSPAVGDSTRLSRQHLVELWTMCNGKLDPQDVIDEIVAGNVTAEDTGLRLLDAIKELTPGTIAQYLTMLGGEGKPRKGAGFLLSVLGKQKFDVDEFASL